jgi:ferritin-like metal-binding protein YciE
MENTRERLVRYLQDAHAAEVGIRKMLEGFVDDTDDQNIKMLFQEHLTVTRTQEDRLEQCLRKYNSEPSDGKGFFNTIMAKMSDMMHGAHDQYDKNTQNLIKAYGIEHLECGMYEALAAFAQVVGDEDVVQVAQTIQSEEKEAGKRIWPMIAKHATMALGVVNPSARAYPG